MMLGPSIVRTGFWVAYWFYKFYKDKGNYKGMPYTMSNRSGQTLGLQQLSPAATRPSTSPANHFCSPPMLGDLSLQIRSDKSADAQTALNERVFYGPLGPK